MINFLHTFQPDSVLFELGFLTIRWYGLLVVCGILSGLLLASKVAKKYHIPKDEVYNLAFYVIIFGLLGARLYAVLLEWSYYLANPFEIIAVWHGGLAIHGGLIGGLAAAVIYCYVKKLPLWRIADVAVPGIALGQAIGRFGNYFNQELFGRPTDLPWGIPIASQNRPDEFINFTYFHPTFLYESVLNLLNVGILLLLHRYFDFPRGIIFFIYLINYSIIRILMETLRTDPAPLVLGLRVPVLVSICLVGLSLVAIAAVLKNKKVN